MKLKFLGSSLVVATLASIYSMGSLAHADLNYVNGNGHKSRNDYAEAFNGFFIGAEGGYAHSKERININIPGTHPSLRSQSYNGSGDDFAGDVYVGYGYQAGVFHIAARATVDTNKLTSSSLALESGNISYLRKASLYRVFGVDIQPGFLVTPRMLIFADLGVGYYHFDYSSNVNDKPHYFDNANQFRVNVGGGVSYALTHHISMHALVQYTPNITEHFEAVSNQNFQSIRTNIMRYMVGVSYSFT